MGALRAGSLGEGLVTRLRLSDEVGAALAAGRPVVALESTLISHGLPFPLNLEVAANAEEAVRRSGATPATVAIRDGAILVGLGRDDLVVLASSPPGGVRKASRPSLAAALARGGWAATTVSATMIVARAAGISVFATGGIGGVHRGAFGGTAPAPLGGTAQASLGGTDEAAEVRPGLGLEPHSGASFNVRPGTTAEAEPQTIAGARPGRTAAPPTGHGPSFDVSVDLEELARTPVAVVCAGPKAILDVAGTIEWLESRGVPVVVIGQDEVPGFWCRTSGVPAPESVPDVREAAAVVATHLELGLGGGILVCVPVPETAALPEALGRAAVEQAVAEAEAAGIGGAALTPWLLSRIGELTDGASLRANAALVVENARVAGELARELATRR